MARSVPTPDHPRARLRSSTAGAACTTLVLASASLWLGGCTSDKTTNAAARQPGVGTTVGATTSAPGSPTPAVSGGKPLILDTNTADPPAPNGPMAPMTLRQFPATWQAANLMTAVTRVSGAHFATTQETGAGSGGGTLTSAQWTDPASGLELSVNISKRPDGVIDVIQCYARGANVKAAVSLFQLCADNTTSQSTSHATADAWVAAQSDLLEHSPAATTVGKTYTTAQPAFDGTRMVIRLHLLTAGNPVMDMLLTSA